MKLNSIDLFAGIGGISLGLHAAGVETVAAIDLDKSCAEVFGKNFPNTDFYCADLSELDPQKVALSTNKEIDIIVGGPPCQGFSLIGLRDPSDQRSQLIFEFRRWVRELKPKYFVMENVPGMLSAEKGKWVSVLMRQLESDGYRVSPPTVLNAAEFGVPQERRRVFLLGTRKDLKFDLMSPSPTHYSPRSSGKVLELLEKPKPVTTTVWEAIHDLPDIERHPHLVEEHEVPYDKQPKSAYARMMRGIGADRNFFGSIPSSWAGDICTNCKRIVHGDVLRERFEQTTPGTTVPVSRLFKLDPDSTANTLRAGTPSTRGSYSSPRPVHPVEPRCISVREGARLQGFPDWFRFHETKWHGFRQVGNSVSPIVAKHVANEIVRCYELELETKDPQKHHLQVDHR